MLLIVIAALIVVFILKKIFEKRALKQQDPQSKPKIEDYIPESLMNSVFKCSSCGAHVPAKTNNHVTMFCSFCGASLKDAHILIKNAQQSKKEQDQHELELKRLAEKERQQNIELRAKLAKQEHIRKEKTQNTQIFILAFFGLGIITFIMLGVAGVFGK